MEGKPELAVSARRDSNPERYKWAAENGLRIEYTFDGHHPLQIPAALNLAPVRFHALLPQVELGWADTPANPVITAHLAVLDAVSVFQSPVITVHVGMNKQDEVRFECARDNLARIVEYGQHRGITVLLENLKRGYTSWPENVVRLAEATGAGITFDIGHALSCEQVKNDVLAPGDFIDAFAGWVFEAHVYGWEDDRHYPIDRPETVVPLLDKLLTLKCPWWTIELDDCREVISTRDFLVDYLKRQEVSFQAKSNSIHRNKL